MFSIKKVLLIATATLLSAQTTFGFEIIEKCQKSGDFALTFDDGPSLEHTSLVLDILKKENVKATFFVNGKNCVDVLENKEAQELIKREYAEGHNIASHTFTHPDDGITELPDDVLRKEIKDLNDMLSDLIGVKPAFFRPPKGEVKESNNKILEEEGIKAVINWSLDSNDWKEAQELKKFGTTNVNATANYLKILDRNNPTETSLIALNHDINDVTAKRNLALIIPIIRARGWKFVTMDECLGMSAYQNIDSLKDKKIDTNIITGNATVTTTTIERVAPTIVLPDQKSKLNASGAFTQTVSVFTTIALVSLTILNFL